ncbi:MAG TPA: RraA family protein [Actinomycetota bacterium]|jgi:regulator of RNase E activity RraA|nr:RraA family protein [Actinomycetota bacterium]
MSALIDELRSFSTPSILNGIETFDVRPRETGFMDSSIRCMFPELGVMVGYAATATIRSRDVGPPSKDRELWAHESSLPSPRIVVIQDLDDPPGVGSYWGEVNSTIHTAFGAIGVITNGCVRDLDEMRAKPFFAFAGSIGVSHANVHVVDVGLPVTVGGLEVKPGDLLHGDQHGVALIPFEIAEKLPEAVRDVEHKEQGVINLFSAPDFDASKFIGDVTH